jgi:hypothetical protein
MQPTPDLTFNLRVRRKQEKMLSKNGANGGKSAKENLKSVGVNVEISQFI